MLRLVVFNLAVSAVAACFVVGCAERSREGVLILAAASTQEAVAEAGRRFEAETGIAVQINAAGSNALAAQILAGAPADLFLAASPVWVDRVREAGLTSAVAPLLGNELVLVVPKGNPAGVRGPEDLLSPRVGHVALAGETVPAGLYAEQALTSLGLYADLVRQNRVARGQDVRMALGYVERGEAEAGLVYASDARISTQVEVVAALDPATHEPVVYPLALLTQGAGNPAARRFFEFLISDSAAALFEAQGFTRIERVSSPAGDAP